MAEILVVLYIAEFIVGVIQLIGALIRTIYKLSAGLPLGKLRMYWIMVLCYFIVLLGSYYAVTVYTDHVLTSSMKSINELNDNDDLAKSTQIIFYLNMGLAVWIGLAWIIAIWYWKTIVFKSKENPDVQL